MTLGNDPQPLTRRQARELARGQEPVLSADEQNRSSTADGRKAPKPRRAGTPEATHGGDVPQITTTSPEVIKQADVTDVAPAVSAFARGANGADSASASKTINKRPVPERTLSRRELRALKAAEATETVDEEAPTGPLNPPVGHWSVDPDDDGHTQTTEQDLPLDELIARGLGAGGIPTTANALILPSLPNQGTISGPLSSTGEVLITGSIDLPRSLGATGEHPDHFDSSEVDHMLDQLDEGAPTTTVAPVSASRAISTHTPTRGLMTPPKKRGATLPTVLAVTAAILALGVLALFVAGYVFKIF